MSIIIPFILIAVIGALLGFGLAVADKKLSIKKDEKLELIEASMPNANCGGCGFAGCSAYAEAVYTHKAPIGLCSPGGSALAKKMAEIMGEEAVEMEKKTAHVFCSAVPAKEGKDFQYQGIEDCNGASLLFKGENSCKEGCIGLGSCIKVCPEGAIKRREDGSLFVQRELCIGCGKCEKICPNHVIRLVPSSQLFFTDCNSHAKGAEVRKYCEFGCIGCGICEKKFPASGFKVDSFLASFDPKAIDISQAGDAMAACPRKVIKKVE